VPVALSPHMQVTYLPVVWNPLCSTTHANPSHGPQVAMPSTPLWPIKWPCSHQSNGLTLKHLKANIDADMKAKPLLVTTLVVQMNYSSGHQLPTCLKECMNPSHGLQVAVLSTQPPTLEGSPNGCFTIPPMIPHGIAFSSSWEGQAIPEPHWMMLCKERCQQTMGGSPYATTLEI
jgi:hypothetical protein